VTPRLHDAAWETVWTAFEETGLILSFHVVVFFGGSQNNAPAPEEGKTASVFTNTKLFMGQFLDPFVDLFAWGILERHPRLKLVMAESGLAGCHGRPGADSLAAGGQSTGTAWRYRPDDEAQRAVSPPGLGRFRRITWPCRSSNLWSLGSDYPHRQYRPHRGHY
jgi:hypothetical protein